MQFTPTTSEQARSRYAAWERSAGITLLVLCACFTASLVVRVPGIPFVVLSVAAGVLMFVSWRMSLSGRSTASLAAALAALPTALMALSQELATPLVVLLSQGLSLVASALFAGILVFRRRQA